MTDDERIDETGDETPKTERGLYKYDRDSDRWVLLRREPREVTPARAALGTS